jgi:hypothetical protein
LPLIVTAQTPGTVKSAIRISARAGSLGVSSNWKEVGQAATSFQDLDGDGIRELAFTALDVPSQGYGIFIHKIDITGKLKAGNPIILSKGYSPLSSLTTKYPGIVDAERIGVSLTTLKDLNGNGIDEIVAGDFFKSRLYILYMNAAGTADSVSLIQDNFENFSLYFNDGLLGLGGVGNLGDVNGDGVADLAAYAGTDNGYGAVYVLLMKNNGRVKGVQRLTHNSGGIGALTPNYGFGNSPVGIGDLDGDGTPDMMAGAVSSTNNYRGELWTLFLKPDGSVKSYTITKPNTATFPDTLSARASFAAAITPVGDLDGDSVIDVAVSSPGYVDSLGKNYGRTYVLFMKKDGTPKARQVIDRYYGNLSLPLDSFSSFGFSLFSPGDFNKDRIPDLGVGAPNARETGAPPAASPFNGTGAIYMLSLNGVAPVQTGTGDLLQNFSDNYFLYPNPSSDRLRIRSRKQSNSKLQVRLYDGTGQIVTTQSGSGNVTLEIDVLSLPVGTYLIAIEDSNGTQYGKFVRN